MKLIADSGSSKTEWRVIDDQGSIHQARTPGLNPYHISDENIRKELWESLIPRLKDNGLDANLVKEVFFYGSGCVPGTASDRMKANLETVFTKAQAEINDDLLAVARGLCGRENGIIAILGTGANSGVYDGEKVTEKIKALGYILGDEGSGAWIGKNLLALYLRGELNPSLSGFLEKRLGQDQADIFEKVYRTPHANRYLAGFSRFVFQHIREPQMYKLVYDGFRYFMEHNILRYSGSSQMPVHFSGSVAFYYSNILRQVAADLQIRTGHVVEGPIAGLTLYHKQ